MIERKDTKIIRIILTLAIAIVMAGAFVLYERSAIYGAYTESIVTITKDGQVTDSFCGVDAEYITTYSDTGIYSCAEYVKKYYATLFGANVYQINTYDGPPLVSMDGHTVSLRQVTVPKPGDIMQNTERTHVAVVKYVSGNSVTLIEQNYKWTSAGKLYTRVNRTIDVKSAYFYRLVIDGKEAVIEPSMSGTITKDTTPPVISNVKITDINSTGYTVTCTVTDDVQVDRVQFPTWTVFNGQDDLCGDWNENLKVRGTINGNTVTFRVNISEHNGEKGKYATHIYAFDSSGNASSYMIEPLYAGHEDMGKSFYAVISSSQKTFVTNDTTNVTARIKKSTTADSRKQMWKFTKQSDGSYKITSAADGKALYVNGASGAHGANIIPYTNKTSKGQNWYIYKINGTYQFGAACSDCYMTLYGGSSADGTNIKMTNKNGKSYQNFNIEKFPEQPAIISVVSEDYNKLTIHYSTLNNVHGYKIYRLNDSTQTYQLVATVKSPTVSSYTDTSCIAGKKYFYKVRAYTNVSSTNQLLSDYSSGASGVSVPKATAYTSAVATSTSVSLKWTSLTGASGYEIYRSTDKNGKYYKIKDVSSGSRYSYTDSGLKTGKSYYYKIKVYKKVNGVNICSAYSAPIHAKTK